MVTTPSGPEAEEVERLLRGTPYRLLRNIGKGGMGAVYEVEHEELGRRLALKVMHPMAARDEQVADRMRIEARAMGKLRHPAAVEVIDFWIGGDGRPCIVMELLRGRTLAQELRERRRLPPSEVVSLGIDALSALGAAHALGIVHRDVKPENLFLHAVSDGRELRILDFGLARILPWLSADTAPTMAVPTATGAIVGSPLFMSPEAAAGKRLDARTDLYSLGVVLYLALAGRRPLVGSLGPAEPPSRRAEAHVPPELDTVLLKAIEHRTDARYQTAEEFSRALAAAHSAQRM